MKTFHSIRLLRWFRALARLLLSIFDADLKAQKFSIRRGLVFAELSSLELIEKLENKQLALVEEAESIEKKADSEERAKTEEEQTRFSQCLDEAERIRGEIGDRRRLLAKKEEMSRLQPRRAVPVDAPAAPNNPTRKQIEGGAPTAASFGNHGFRSFGEFAKCVQKSCATHHQVHDQRLTINAAASTYGSESVGEDGGFAIPPDFRQDIMKKVMAEDSLLGRTDQLFTSSNQITVPWDETTPWQSSGGIQAYWQGEASAATQTKPELQSRTTRLNKLFALVPVTDELLADAGALSTYLRGKAPEKIDFKINDAIVNGTGAGMPQGIMAAAAKVTVNKESGQAANTVLYANVVNMAARFYMKAFPSAIWLANQDVLPQLQQMALIVGSATTSLGFPAYMPPGGLSGSPYSTLMGKPILFTEACQALSTEGDLILVDLSRYMTAQKIEGLREDVSIHLWFDQDVTAFRFILRLGGQSWWNGPIKRKSGNNTLSHIVTLQSR